MHLTYADGQRRSILARYAVVTLLIVVALAGVSGLTESIIFSEDSSLKLLLTSLLPALALSLLARPNQALILSALAIVSAPFSLEATIQNVPLSPTLVLLSTVTVLLFTRRPVPGRALLSTSVLTACIAVVVTLVLSDLPPTSVGLLIAAAEASYVVYSLTQDPSDRAVLTGALLFAITLQALLALFEFRTGHPLNLYTPSSGTGYAPNYFFTINGQDRPSGGLPDPNSLGNVLAFGVPVYVAVLGFCRRTWERLLISLGMLLVLLGLTVTFSRASWVAGLLGLILALSCLPRERRLSAGLALALCVLVAVVVGGVVAGPTLTARVESISDPTNPTVATANGDRERNELQTAGLRIALSNTLTGVGWGQVGQELSRKVPGETTATHTHNLFINIFAETGLMGLVPLLGLMGGAVLRLRGLIRIDPFSAGLAGAVLTIVTTWTTDYTARNASVLTVVCVVFAMIFASAKRFDVMGLAEPVHTG